MSRGDQPAEPEWMACNSSNTSSSTTTQITNLPLQAKPSGACCLKGFLHNGEPRGRFERLANNIETYITEPPKDKANGHVVLYYPDVFGFFTNGLLVMDSFAEAGYLVAGIDYFCGDPIYMHRSGPKEPKEGFDFEAWLARYQKFADENIVEWINAVKQKYGNPDTKYACTGYCFGAPYVMNSLSTNYFSDPPCTAGAFAHPAFLKEHHFANLSRPLFLSCAETDFTFETAQRNKAIDMLREAKKPYHLQLFQGVEHGFALRCDLSKPYERWCKEQSVKGIAEWFDLQLGVYEKKSETDDAKL